jgi:hypothetical protein
MYCIISTVFIPLLSKTVDNKRYKSIEVFHCIFVETIHYYFREEDRRRKEEEEVAAAAAAKAALTEEEEKELENAPPPVLPYSSLFIFSSTNGFRVTVHSIVTFPLFDVFIMLVIIASSIALAAEDPVDPKSARNIFLGKLDYGFTCVFAIEVCLKVKSSLL